MKIKVSAGQSPVVVSHIGSGDERRMVFITPWGCSLSELRRAPATIDVSPREYTVDVTGEVERLLRSTLKTEHPLSKRVSIVDDPAAPPAAAPAKAGKSKAAAPAEDAAA